jgi:isopentenyl diphosphate isomerase/L-lactate dehydrogenase-like FMN-dependent dehydrogenase
MRPSREDRILDTTLPESAVLVNADVVDAARARLKPPAWDFLAGGAGSEATVRRNRAALDALVLEPRVLRASGEAATATSFVGVPLALPVMLAPIGTISLFARGGAATCARAAGRAGTAAWVSVQSAPPLEAAAAAAPVVFQIHVRADRANTTALADRAAESGCAALCLTVDSAVQGYRERDRRNGFAHSNRGGDTPLLSWADVEWLAGRSALPLVLKGVTAAADAAAAVDSGAAAVVVSNHGGRQLDHQRGAAEALVDVVDAVGDRIEVAMDGGIMRGADVVKALALGARAVLVGRLQCCALAAGGEDALAQVLDRLREEIRTTLALLGANGPSELRRTHVAVSSRPFEHFRI